MAGFQDMERELNRAVFTHLSEEELGAYYDGTLSEVTRARADAHLKRCLICYRRLSIIQEYKRSLILKGKVFLRGYHEFECY
ncbi:MAG TPA: zf-HC2 domain-containing protein [Dehalococcoidia bacterium]|nr:zf-HC2 domain-containing protein [Dehalococcoidia bacterium]